MLATHCSLLLATRLLQSNELLRRGSFAERATVYVARNFYLMSYNKINCNICHNIFNIRIVSRCMPELSAILAFHENEGMLDAFSRALKMRGYAPVDVVRTPAELLGRVAITSYDFYAMDANLGYPNASIFDTAQELYARLRDRVALGEVKFYAASVNPDIVEDAKRIDLPAMTKLELEDLIHAIPMVKK